MTMDISSTRESRLEMKQEQQELEILVIEDEDLMSALILRYLESSVFPSMGFTAANKPKVRILDRGWDLLQSDLSKVRVAIVDLLLPQVTGIDLIRNFRSRYPGMGVLPLSGMATEPMRRNLNEILKGDFALVEKPLRKEAFKSAFAKAWSFWNPDAGKKEASSTSVWSENGAEPSWNSVSSLKSNQGVLVEKRKLSKKSPDSPGSEDPPQ